MLVSVIYFDNRANAYCGRDYTYRTKLPLKVFQKVLVPVMEYGCLVKKKAVVTDINLPESVVKPEWADKVKWITEIDEGDKG